jgi:hypothetical protein
MPLVAFWVIYGLTCMIGALLMLGGFHDFNRLYQYFSGTSAAHLTDAQAGVDLLLLFAAPAALWIGYEIGLTCPLPQWAPRLGQRIRSSLADGRVDTPPWFSMLVFYGFAAVAIISIAHSGSLTNVGAWLNYNSWIAAREQAFKNMRFFEFVNIYLLVPVAAAWVVITYRKAGVRGVLLRWLPLLITLGIDVLLFQKKTAIISLMIIMFAWVLAAGPQGRHRVTRRVGMIAFIAITIYIATVVVPVWSKASTASICGISGISCHGTAGVPALAAYTILSPLTRGSAPALYYPVIFPHYHAFYPIKSIFALDILGIGTFPNDNQVVWHFMNPHLPGTTQVPFQFTLFSQGGLQVALIGSLVAGMLLALGWRFVRSGVLPRTWSALAGSMVLLLGVYLGLDSLRNSTLVSYGMVWGVLFIGIALLVVRFGNSGATSSGRIRVPAGQFGARLASRDARAVDG